MENIDYRKFKTPFYEVEVSDSEGNRKVKLPHHILRLINRVEIYEVYSNDEVQEFGTLTINFIEGSREPASPDATLGTQGLYKIPLEGDTIDTDISGSLTNRVGIITDLRFSGNSGITFITEKEKNTGRIDNSTQVNVVGQETTREHTRDKKSPLFLFQERNQIKVTWGYKEDPDTIREFVGHIITVQTEYPENEQIKTTITCQEPAAFLDQIAATKGIPFGKKVNTSNGNSIVIFEDSPTSTLIKDLCDKSDMACIVSQHLPAEKVDKDKQKVWLAGESFTEFMNRLAKMNNSYWRIIIDPKTRKQTLVFVKKVDFEAKTILANDNLLTFKNPGSILKRVSIKADFGGIIGNAEKSIDKDGNETKEQDKEGEARLKQFKSADNTKPEEWLDADPTKNNAVPSAKGVVNGVLSGSYSGKVNNNPSDDKSVREDVSANKAAQMARLINIEFTTIGYTKLRPGVVEIKGIGVRYSGKYRLLTVTHTIDESGYITKCNGISQSLAFGGVKVQDAPKGQETEEQVSVKQFNAPNAQDDIISKLNQLQGIK